MKQIIITTILIVSTINVKSQSWYAMGTIDTVGNSNGNKAIGAISFYNNKITVAGNFKKEGAQVLNGEAQWNGTNWTPMGIGEWWGDGSSIDSVGEGYCGLVSYKNNLYNAGTFAGAGGSHINDTSHLVGNIAKWDGTDWYPLCGSYPPYCGFNYSCTALHNYNNNLYIGGGFGTSYDATGSHTTQGIAKWNDTVFSTVGQFAGDFPPNYDFNVWKFCTFNSKLIAGGAFTSINGSAYGTYSGIAAWDGTTWSAFGIGFNNTVFSLAVYNGELYAGGIFTATRDNLTPLNHLAKWNGVNWQAVGEGLNDTVYCLCVDSIQNKLYAGGAFTQTGLGVQAKHIAEWTGVNWQEVGGGTNRDVAILFSEDSNLYVGGEFTRAGNVQASLIACWGYGLTVGVGDSELGVRNEELGIYPNPTSGLFTISTEGRKVKEIKITNIIGDEIKAINNSTMVDLTDVAKGIYFVEVKTEQSTVRKKIIKQ